MQQGMIDMGDSRLPVFAIVEMSALNDSTNSKQAALLHVAARLSIELISKNESTSYLLLYFLRPRSDEQTTNRTAKPVE